MNVDVVLGLLLFAALLFVHLVREAFHAANRAYVRWLLDGRPGNVDQGIPPSEQQVRAVLALRFGRVLVLVAWVLYLANLLGGTRGWLYWLAGLGLATMVDELARVGSVWVNMRFPHLREVLVTHSQGLVGLFLPAVWVREWISRRFFGFEEQRDVVIPVSEEQVIVIAHREGETPILAQEIELIDNIIDFRDTIVREIMVPRLDIVAVEADAPLQKALDTIIEHGHSRIPVFEDNIDQIVGILYAKDLLRHFREAMPHWPEVSLRDMLRHPHYVPDTKRVSALLPEMRQNKVHLAIVVDEYGGTAGLVTIEDVLEEIVGEIQDEYDREIPEMQKVGDNEYLINARADIEDVSDFIAVELPEDEADTLGGFIYSRLEAMPKVGDEVVSPPVRMRVISVNERRIGQVLVIVEEQPMEIVSSSQSAALEGKHHER